MYFVEHTLNVVVENKTENVIRGLELKYLKDIGRTAKACKINPGEGKNLFIMTKEIQAENKFIIKLKSGKECIVDCNVIDNTLGYILKIEIDSIKENIVCRAKYIKVEDEIA